MGLGDRLGRGLWGVRELGGAEERGGKVGRVQGGREQTRVLDALEGVGKGMIQRG